MNEPLVSILIPAYNVEKYIEECLESVVNQTYKNLQVVVVDDGSTDGTARILDKYAGDYDFIEVYHIPNGGVANARNQLLAIAKGEYVLFVDSDDWIEADMVEGLLKLIQNHRLDVAVCGKYKERGREKTCTETCEIWNREESIKRFLEHKKINGALWNKLIRSELLRGISFDPSVSYGEDALVVWEVLKKVCRIGVIESGLYHHRLNQGSISHEGYGPKMKTSHKVWDYFARDTEKTFPQFAELAKANYAVADFWLLYFAALGGTRQDTDITIYRKHLKNSLSSIRKQGLLPPLHFAVSVGLAYSYPAVSPILRRLKR